MEAPKDRYATLSHCWGKDSAFITLRADNLKSLQTDVPPDSLPRSFQDAVTTCRRLGIWYLWIDSLCIIQSSDGSKEDWLEQATEMQSVYLNCALNIAIDRAGNPHEGAFTERNTDCLQPCHIQWKYSGSDETSWTWYDSSDSICALRCLPLSKRAWVLQERLLSPRILHFGHDRIFWERKKTYGDTVNEYTSGDYGTTVGCFEVAVVPIFTLPTRPQNTINDQDGNTKNFVELNGILGSLVRNYFEAYLTYPEKDKLIAFSGIARHLSQAYRDDYMAGFFSSQFPWILPWYACPSTLSESLSKYHAPSWSWASTNRYMILFNYNRYQREKVSSVFIAKVSGIEMTLVDKINRYGQFERGELGIYDVLFLFEPASFDWDTFCATFNRYQYQSRGLEFPYDLGSFPTPNVVATRQDASTSGSRIRVYPDDLKGFAHCSETLFLFPVIEIMKTPEADKLPSGGTGQVQVFRSDGLILRESWHEGAYKRVGMYNLPELLAKPVVELEVPEELVKII